MLTLSLFKLWFIPLLFRLPPKQKLSVSCAFLLGIKLNMGWKETIWISASLFVCPQHQWHDFISYNFLCALILKQNKETMTEDKDGSPLSLPHALQGLFKASPVMCLEPGYGYEQLHSSARVTFYRKELKRAVLVSRLFFL